MNNDVTPFIAAAGLVAAIVFATRKPRLPAGVEAPAAYPSVAQIERAIVGMLESEHASRPPALVRTIARAIHEACALEGLDPALLLASGYTESRFNPAAVSSINALGIWQQLPQFGQYYSDACWDNAQRSPRCTWTQVANRPQEAEIYSNDVPQAARIAARHFAYLIRKYGSFEEGICRYAAGGRGAGCAAGRSYMERLKERMEWARSFF